MKQTREKNFVPPAPSVNMGASQFPPCITSLLTCHKPLIAQSAINETFFRNLKHKRIAMGALLVTLLLLLAGVSLAGVLCVLLDLISDFEQHS